MSCIDLNQNSEHEEAFQHVDSFHAQVLQHNWWESYIR
jgi:hypothetical protein